MKLYVLLLLIPFIGLSQQFPDYKTYQGMRYIQTTYGDVVKASPYTKVFIGRNPDVNGSSETVWNTGGLETFTAGNAIVNIVSTSELDSQLVYIIGHQVIDDELVELQSIDTLTGTTAKTLTNPYHSIEVMFNYDDNDFNGTITAEESGGTPRITITSGNQSKKGSGVVAYNEYMIVTKLVIGVLKGSASGSRVDFDFQIKEYGKVWRTIYTATCNTTAGTIDLPLDPHFVIPKNHYFRVNAVSSSINTTVEIVVGGHLARIE